MLLPLIRRVIRPRGLARLLPITLVAGATWVASAMAENVIPIGAVQGSLPAGLSGKAAAEFPSPLAGKQVAVQGVVTQRYMGRTRGGNPLNGIFIQNTKATADADPASSDGIFVFMGKFGDLLPASGDKSAPKYTPAVGDEVILKGTAKEFHGGTQLDQARLVQLVRKGVALDQELATPEADPPADSAATAAYWEKLEGMRVALPAGLSVQGHAIEDGRLNERVIYVARPDRLPNAGGDPYARRVFRDAHPLDNVPDRIFDDGNGYRFLLCSAGLRGATGNIDAKLPTVRSFATSAAPTTACVYYTFDTWVLTPSAIDFKPGLDPSKNSPPQEPKRDQEFSIASFNVENLYDRRDDPFDQNDFTGNAGEKGVKPPFNYVPASEEAYQAHLKGLALEVVNDLHTPDVLLVQEAEDQDIAALEGGQLKITGKNDADGKPDTIQELALAIKAAGGPEYDCAFDRDGADNRGIVCAFMWRVDRAELLPAEGDALFGAGAKIDYPSPPAPYTSQVSNPKAFNAALPATVAAGERDNEGQNVLTRAVQGLRVRVWSGGVGKGKSVELTLINNHFSSRPNARVGQRIQQAAFNAALYQAFAKANPQGLYLMGGDLNIYPRPDDPFADKPSDQLAALYTAGLQNLWDTIAKEAPAAAYSYVFDGQAQTLDQMFVNPALFKHLVQARVAHINCDWPEDAGPGRAASDHDPLMVRFRFE